MYLLIFLQVVIYLLMIRNSLSFRIVSSLTLESNMLVEIPIFAIISFVYLFSFLSNSEVIDLSKLVVLEGKHVWRIYVGLTVSNFFLYSNCYMIFLIFLAQILQLDSFPEDACSIAIYAALSSCKLPCIEEIRGRDNKAIDYEVISDWEKSRSLPILNIPLCISILKVNFLCSLSISLF